MPASPQGIDPAAWQLLLARLDGLEAAVKEMTSAQIVAARESGRVNEAIATLKTGARSEGRKGGAAVAAIISAAITATGAALSAWFGMGAP